MQVGRVELRAWHEVSAHFRVAFTLMEAVGFREKAGQTWIQILTVLLTPSFNSQPISSLVKWRKHSLTLGMGLGEGLVTEALKGQAQHVPPHLLTTSQYLLGPFSSPPVPPVQCLMPPLPAQGCPVSGIHFSDGELTTYLTGQQEFQADWTGQGKEPELLQPPGPALQAQPQASS